MELPNSFASQNRDMMFAETAEELLETVTWSFFALGDLICRQPQQLLSDLEEGLQAHPALGEYSLCPQGLAAHSPLGLFTSVMLVWFGCSQVTVLAGRSMRGHV